MAPSSFLVSLSLAHGISFYGEHTWCTFSFPLHPLKVKITFLIKDFLVDALCIKLMEYKLFFLKNCASICRRSQFVMAVSVTSPTEQCVCVCVCTLCCLQSSKCTTKYTSEIVSIPCESKHMTHISSCLTQVSEPLSHTAFFFPGPNLHIVTSLSPKPCGQYFAQCFTSL